MMISGVGKGGIGGRDRDRDRDRSEVVGGGDGNEGVESESEEAEAEDRGAGIEPEGNGQIEVEGGQAEVEVPIKADVVEEGELAEIDRNELSEDLVQEEEEGEEGEILVEEGEIEDYGRIVGMGEKGEVVEQERYQYQYQYEEMSNGGEGRIPGFTGGEDGGGAVDVSGVPREVEDGELVDDGEEDIVRPTLGVGMEASGVVRPNLDDASASGLEEGEVVDSSRDEEVVRGVDEEVDMELDSDGEGFGYGRIETIHGSPHEAGGGFLHLVMALSFSQCLLFSFRPLSCRYTYNGRAYIDLYRHIHTTIHFTFNLDGHSPISFDCTRRRTLEVQTEAEARQA